MSRIIYYGKVKDVMDPANLGRIRYTSLDLSQSALDEAFPTSSSSGGTNYTPWSMNDPFLVYPLLPIFLYQVPKEGEYVHIIFYDNEQKQNNRFYIQGNFSSIDSIYQDKFDNMVAGLALGERVKEVGRSIITTQTGIPTNSENLGLYPNPKSTIGLLGRKNSDILLPEDGFIARVNKQIQSSSGVTYNKQNSFTMLQTYPSRNVETEKTIENVTMSVYQDLNYLIEYNIYGGLNRKRKYTAYIEVFKVSPYKKISTSAFKEGSDYAKIDDFAKIGPIYRKEYRSEDFDTITNGFRKIIKNLNDNNKIGLPGELEFPVNGSAFPFVYRPNEELYNILQNNPTDNEKDNILNFINAIYLNRTQVQKDVYGLVSEKDTMGILKEAKQIIVDNPKPQVGATTVAATASNFLFLLSQGTKPVDGLNKIDFQDATATTGNTLDENFVWNTIYPNTMSMVRGEKMMELLELIVKYMVSHVHPYHGMTPVPVSMDGTNSAKILQQMYEGYQNILNTNLRINWYL